MERWSDGVMERWSDGAMEAAKRWAAVLADEYSRKCGHIPIAALPSEAE